MIIYNNNLFLKQSTFAKNKINDLIALFEFKILKNSWDTILEFSKTLFLALALALPIAAWALGHRRRKVFENQFGHSYISAAPQSKVSIILSSTRLFLCILACALLVFVLLGMEHSERKISSSNGKKTLCLAFDVSRSMLAPDGAESRLARAKKSAEIIIGNTGFDCISVVAFAGSASLALPPTSDFATARALIASLDPEQYQAQGSSINRAIELAALSRADTTAFAACVVLSDGEFHDEAVRSRIAAPGLAVDCLMFGAEGAKIPLAAGGFVKDAGGADVVSVPKPDALKKIADWTNGKFLAAENYDAVTRFAKETLAVPPIIDQSNSIDWRLVSAFALIIGFLFLPEYRLGGRARVSAVAVAILSFAAVESQSVRERPFEHGFTEYRNANYSLAADWFARAAEKESDSPMIAICQYNQANALYKSSFVASKDSTDQLLSEAIGLYKESLRAQPSDSMAQYNLTMALIRLAKLRQSGSPKARQSAPVGKESKEPRSARTLNAQDMKQLIQLAKRNSLRPGMSAGKKDTQISGQILKAW